MARLVDEDAWCLLYSENDATEKGIVITAENVSETLSFSRGPERPGSHFNGSFGGPMSPDASIKETIHLGWMVGTGSENSRSDPVGNGQPCGVNRFR